MGTLSRREMIEDLLRRIMENIHPVEIFGYSLTTDSPQLDTARKALESYSQYLLITLHSASKSPSHRYSAFFNFAHEGKDEDFVNTYCLLTDHEDKLFDNDWAYVCNIETAVKSLALYHDLKVSERGYEQKVIALTGAVTMIQGQRPATESQYSHDDAKFLRYIKLEDTYGDPETADEGDTVVRLANDDLAQLIMERPDDWERIVRIVLERDTDDTEVILPIINADVSSLSSGTL